ncbi:MAG TPA: hypothetical protein VNX46_11135 [Candidatus Acidoferrum sp.]|nr:hypothetical protein [Candidatus Acidoferrum sp.]
MNARPKKIILFVLMVALIIGAGRVQQSLNVDRDRLGMTHMATLDNAPPMLAFTTVALGGFRGLISNFLWIRANDLQQDDKFFEAAQLANWITDLEPHFSQVWVFQGWNMAYNISVKFKDYPDRWRWVENGFSLLRDKGLHYNPDDVLMYRELAWDFQHKMGANLDDANVYYKSQWAKEMAPFFGPQGTNFIALLHPQTPEEKTNAIVLREKFKIDPVFAEKVNEEWGPLDWRLPESHAIYWGLRGLDAAKKNPDKVSPNDLIMLRRILYQSMQQSFYHGRIIANPYTETYSLGPNLDLVEKANDSYLNSYDQESQPGQKQGILGAHRNFLRDAIYFLYENYRLAEAAKWYKVLCEKYPDKPILDGEPNSLPKTMTVDDYAVARVQSELSDTSQERTTAVVQGLLSNAYLNLAIGSDDRYQGFINLVKQIYAHYKQKTATNGKNSERNELPNYNELNRSVLHDLLDPQGGLPFAARAVLRTQLGLPAETNAPAANPVAEPATNADATVSTNSSAQ